VVVLFSAAQEGRWWDVRWVRVHKRYSHVAVVEANLAVIEALKRKIEELEKIIEMKAEEDPQTMPLTTIPRISHYAALPIKGE
jgi:hypothetical protein